MKKAIIWILVIAVLAAGAYFLFVQNNSFSFRFLRGAFSSRNFQSVRNAAENSAVSESAYGALNAGRSFLGSIAENTQERLAGAGNLAQNLILPRALSSIQRGIDSFIQGIGNVLGVETRNNSDISAPDIQSMPDIQSIIRYSAKINQPVSWNIKNTFDSRFSYDIDWGDGARETGAIHEGASKIVSHSWQKEGDYLIRFKINSISGAIEYKTYILVLK